MYHIMVLAGFILGIIYMHPKAVPVIRNLIRKLADAESEIRRLELKVKMLQMYLDERGLADNDFLNDEEAKN